MQRQANYAGVLVWARPMRDYVYRVMDHVLLASNNMLLYVLYKLTHTAPQQLLEHLYSPRSNIGSIKSKKEKPEFYEVALNKTQELVVFICLLSS